MRQDNEEEVCMVGSSDYIDPSNADQKAILYRALSNAYKEIGLTSSDVNSVIGLDLHNMNDIIDPESKSGVLALYLIRSYRSLYTLVDGDKEEMKLWMRGYNTGTGGIPAEQIKDIVGLVRVMEYLEGMANQTRHFDTYQM